MDNSLEISFSMKLSSAMMQIKKMERDLNKLPKQAMATLRDLLPAPVRSTLAIITFGGIMGLIMSAPRLFGAMTKISIEFQLLTWSIGKHFRPVLDAVAVLLNAIRTGNWNEVTENITIIYNKTKIVIFDLYNRWKNFITKNTEGIQGVKEDIYKAFRDLNTKIYNHLPDWGKKFYDRIYDIVIKIKNKEYINAMKMIYIDPWLWVFGKLIDYIKVNYSTIKGNIETSIKVYKDKFCETLKYALNLIENFKTIGKYIWVFINIVVKLQINKVSNIFISAINIITGFTKPKKRTEINKGDIDRMFGDEPEFSPISLPIFSYTLASGEVVKNLDLDELRYVHSLNLMYKNQNTKLENIKDNFENVGNIYDSLSDIGIEMVGNIFYPKGIETAIYYMREPRSASEWFWEHGFYPTINGPWGDAFNCKTNENRLNSWFFDEAGSFHYFFHWYNKLKKQYGRHSAWYVQMTNEKLWFDHENRSLLDANWVAWNVSGASKPRYQIGGTIPYDDYFHLHKGERLITKEIEPKIDKIKVNFRNNIEIHNMDMNDFTEKLSGEVMREVIKW